MEQTQLENAFKEKLLEVFSAKYEEFLEEKGVSKNYVPYNVFDKVIQAQYEGVDDFINENKTIADENNYNDIIQEFVSENYDSEFILMKFEESFNSEEEGVAEKLKGDMIIQLINKEPYSRASRSFWEAKVRNLTNFKDIAKYSEGDDLGEFVEIYAPEWKEQDED
ncbi:MAG: hypothetical protein LBH78_03325 [Rickettsiales bacterium]|jgi:hypothetical protein|nr:hypothetical protein [Rickettsiales bacterium]